MSNPAGLADRRARPLGEQLAYQRAAHQPGQRLNKEVSGEMPVLSARPAAHRDAAHHRRELVVVKRKARRAMRQPADVLKRPAQQAKLDLVKNCEQCLE